MLCKIIQQKYKKMLIEIHISDIVNLVHRWEVKKRMANVDLLRNKMTESGMTVSAIATKSGILRETLYNRMKEGDFRASEIVALSKTLNLSKGERDKIFLT